MYKAKQKYYRSHLDDIIDCTISISVTGTRWSVFIGGMEGEGGREGRRGQKGRGKEDGGKRSKRGREGYGRTEGDNS